MRSRPLPSSSPPNGANKFGSSMKARGVRSKISVRVLACFFLCVISGIWFLKAQNGIEAVIWESSPSPTEIANFHSEVQSTPPIILLGIFSVENSTERRQMLRSTYPQHSSICSLQHFRQGKHGSDCQVLYTFVIGANHTAPHERTNTRDGPLAVDCSAALRFNAIESKDDLTCLNIQENMNFGKSPSWFAYAATLAREMNIQYIAKVDDDVIIDIDRLLEYFDKQLPKQPKRVYFGDRIMVCHDERNSLCRGIVGDFHSNGGFYVLSTDLAAFISSDRVNRTDVTYTLEDVNMAQFVHRHPDPIDRHVVGKEEQFWVHPLNAFKEERPAIMMEAWKNMTSRSRQN